MYKLAAIKLSLFKLILSFNLEMGLQSRFGLPLHDKPYANGQCHDQSYGTKSPISVHLHGGEYTC